MSGRVPQGAPGLEGKKMKQTLLIFSVALAIFLLPSLAQTTAFEVQTTGDHVVTPGEVSVVEATVPDATTADIASPADDAVLAEADPVTGVPVIEQPGTEEASSEEPVIAEPADPIDDPSEPIIVVPVDPIEDPIRDTPVNPNTTPLPSTLILLGSGLLGLSGLAWRGKLKR